MPNYDVVNQQGDNSRAKRINPAAFVRRYTVHGV